MKKPALRVYHSGNPNLGKRWFSFSMPGVAGGFVSAKGIAMLVAAVLKR